MLIRVTDEEETNKRRRRDGERVDLNRDLFGLEVDLRQGILVLQVGCTGQFFRVEQADLFAL